MRCRRRVDPAHARAYNSGTGGDPAAHKQMTLQAQAFAAGYAVVDMGTTGKKLHGFRFVVKRLADNAIYHFGTVKQVREQIAA
jgi:hypothetical protein